MIPNFWEAPQIVFVKEIRTGCLHWTAGTQETKGKDSIWCSKSREFWWKPAKTPTSHILAFPPQREQSTGDPPHWECGAAVRDPRLSLGRFLFTPTLIFHLNCKPRLWTPYRGWGGQHLTDCRPSKQTNKSFFSNKAAVAERRTF